MKTQELIDAALESAVAIAFDGCHKIYILMDDAQAKQTRSYGYGSGDGDSQFHEVMQTELGRSRAAATLREWWDESCGLRFINTIRTTPNPNDGFDDIIAQGDEWIGEDSEYMRMPAINWDDLRVQKQILLDRIWDDKDDPLWAIVHMIDAMQDIAVEAGAWEFPPACDTCGALAEDESVEWCGNCGQCRAHCDKQEGCE